MRFFALIILAFVSVAGHGQDVDHKVKENKLNKYATDLTFGLNPFFADINGDNSVFGASGDFMFRLNTILSLRGTYLFPYAQDNPTQTSDVTDGYNSISANGNQSFSFFHGELTLNVYASTFDGTAKVKLPKLLRTSPEKKYLKLDKLSQQRLVGLRVGGGQYKSLVKEKDGEFYGRDLTKDFSDPDFFSDLENTTGKNYSNLSYNLLSAGFVFTKIDHYEVHFNDSIKPIRRKAQWIVYAEGLYGMNAELDNVIFAEDVGGSKVETEYEIGKQTEITEFGFRAGFERNVTSTIGYKYGLEVGARPGTGGIMDNTYVALKFGVTLNFKVLEY